MKYLTKLALPVKGDRVAPMHPVLGVYPLIRHSYMVVRCKRHGRHNNHRQTDILTEKVNHFDE